MGNKMQQRRDSKSNWELKNPLLADGQICFETDTIPYKEKLGTGAKWLDTPYRSTGVAPTDPYVHPNTHPASMILEDSTRLWYTPEERAKLKDLHNGGDVPVSKLKTLWTLDGNITIMKAGKYRILAVGAGGGGNACQGQGGGSGQSLDRIFDLNVMDTLTFSIGRSGIGNVNYANNVVLPDNGQAYAGKDGGDTIITIKKLMGGSTETIVLKGGKGATNPAPSALQYNVGTGEDNGSSWKMSMFASNTENNWCGGDGGSSIFGAGGKGGTISFGGYQKTDGSDGLSYGAGGGGSGFRMGNSMNNCWWTCSGDGIQGCVLLEEQ